MEGLHRRDFEEEVGDVDGVHRVVPLLHLLLGDEPELHVVEDGVFLVALVDGLHGCHLGGDAVVHP